MLDTYRKARALFSPKEKCRGGLVLGMVIVVDTFIVALGAAAFGLILFSSFIRSLTHYAMNRFIEMRRHSTGKRRLETSVAQPHASVPSGSHALGHFGGHSPIHSGPTDAQQGTR